jgi:hypothetical protein
LTWTQFLETPLSRSCPSGVRTYGTGTGRVAGWCAQRLHWPIREPGILALARMQLPRRWRGAAVWPCHCQCDQRVVLHPVRWLDRLGPVAGYVFTCALSYPSPPPSSCLWAVLAAPPVVLRLRDCLHSMWCHPVTPAWFSCVLWVQGGHPRGRALCTAPVTCMMASRCVAYDRGGAG